MSDTNLHRHTVDLAWEGDRGRGTASYEAYNRAFRITAAGKPDLLGSADPLFRGDAARHNPEELLLAALGACHMLFYLSLCARAGVRVVGYRDAPVGRLRMEPGGGGRFEEVVLRPRVTLAPGSDRGAAAALHARAGALCFIANSCAFPVRVEGELEAGE